jgi:gas vesicle protein
MNSVTVNILVGIFASALSGLITAIYGASKENKKEEQRRIERYQDGLKLELKDLKIKLYELEKDLSEWKDKYYAAIQELIDVKSELEDALIKLTHIQFHED